MRKFIQVFCVAFAAMMCASTVSAKSKEYKAISFNIRYGTASDGDNSWENRRDAVAKLLAHEAPDFFGLQEAIEFQYTFLAEHLPSRYASVGEGRDGENKGETMRVFYNKRRFRLLDSGTRWLSETPDQVSKGWDAVCRRTVTYVLLKDRRNGKKICYLNTHLDHKGPIAREQSIKLLCDIIREVAPQGVAVVLGGDMNSSLKSSIYEPLYADGFSSARDVAPITDTGTTFTDYGKARGSQIDHFFVRGFQPRVFSVLRNDYGVPYVSDHYPISIVFSLP